MTAPTPPTPTASASGTIEQAWNLAPPVREVETSVAAAEGLREAVSSKSVTFGLAVGLGVGTGWTVARGVTGPLSLSTGPCTFGLGLGVGFGGSWKSWTDCACRTPGCAAAARTNSGRATGERKRVMKNSVRNRGAKRSRCAAE